MTPTLSPAPLSRRQELLDLLVCPHDHSPLTGWDGFSDDGALTSAGGRVYPVRGGVPCLLPDALRETVTDADADADAEKRNEMAARDAQVGSYDKMMGLKLFTGVELPMTLKYISPAADGLMLEGGCGTGRMTEAFARASRALIALDFSAESLRVARAKLPPDLRDQVLFCQADLSRLPLRAEAFDRVGSFGVYEHIPTPETRADALREMARVLKTSADGGRFAFSAYRWGPPQSWVSAREGHHDGGIYFRRFTAREVRDLAAAHFEVTHQTEALLYYHLVAGRKL